MAARVHIKSGANHDTEGQDDGVHTMPPKQMGVDMETRKKHDPLAKSEARKGNEWEMISPS